MAREIGRVDLHRAGAGGPRPSGSWREQSQQGNVDRKSKCQAENVIGKDQNKEKWKGMAPSAQADGTSEVKWTVRLELINVSILYTSSRNNADIPSKLKAASKLTRARAAQGLRASSTISFFFSKKTVFRCMCILFFCRVLVCRVAEEPEP